MRRKLLSTAVVGSALLLAVTGCSTPAETDTPTDIDGPAKPRRCLPDSGVTSLPVQRTEKLSVGSCAAGATQDDAFAYGPGRETNSP